MCRGFQCFSLKKGNFSWKMLPCLLRGSAKTLMPLAVPCAYNHFLAGPLDLTALATRYPLMQAEDLYTGLRKETMEPF